MTLADPRNVKAPGDAPSWAQAVASDHNAAMTELVTALKGEIAALTTRIEALEAADVAFLATDEDHEARLVVLEP